MAPAMTMMTASSARVNSLSVSRVAVMTASTALAPLTIARVPPNSAATMPTMTPHQSPASAPIPEMTPSAIVVGTLEAASVMLALRSAQKVSRV